MAIRSATSTAYDMGTSAILRQNLDLNKSLLQIATGKRIISPADDPAGAARILDLNQQQQRVNKFQDNVRAAETSLALEEKNLQNMVDLFQRIRELAVQANNDTYDANQRQSISFEVQQLSDSLFAQANSVNGQGEYLYGGFRNDQQPFTKTVGGDVVYNGDQGQKFLQVGEARQVAVNDNGFDVFMDAPGMVGNDGVTKISLFKVVSDLEETMRTNNGPGAGSPETYHESMARGLGNIDAAIGKILDVQASVGARQNATQNQLNVNADFLVQVDTTKSLTQDLDYATAVSTMELQKIGLSAAQQSFTKIQSMNLFNFM